MRSATLTAAMASVMAIGSHAQKIETQPTEAKKIIRVETSKDHLTVIELGDPVTMVAIGNQNAFRVERRENKVFIKPTDEETRTNLFIWTTAGRYVYELVPTADWEQAHFAIDQRPVPVARVTPPTAATKPRVPSKSLPPEMLTQARPVFLYGERSGSGRVQVTIRDLLQKDGRIYLRYALQNDSNQPYQPTHPAAWELGAMKPPISFASLVDRQLGDSLSGRLKPGSTRLLDVVAAGGSSTVPPDGHAGGWLVVRVPDPELRKIRVLRLQFGSDPKGTIEAVLVVPPPAGGEVPNEREATQ